MVKNDPATSIGNVFQSLDNEEYDYDRVNVNYFLKNERKR